MKVDNTKGGSFPLCSRPPRIIPGDASARRVGLIAVCKVTVLV